MGEKYTPKFYLKQPEFKKHDFKRLSKQNFERAHELLNLCAGVLRFEVTFHKFALDYLLENKATTSYLDLLENNFIEKTLIEYLNKLVSNFNEETLKSDEVAKKLVDQYGKIKGMRRYYFYELYFTANNNKRDVLENLYTRSTIWRYKKDIERANINILPLYDIDSAIDIPSRFVVNPEPAKTVALATGRQVRLI